MEFLTVYLCSLDKSEFYTCNFYLVLIIISKLEKMNLVNTYKVFLVPGFYNIVSNPKKPFPEKSITYLRKTRLCNWDT